VHFDYSSLFSDAPAEKVGNPKNICENCTRAEIEPNMSKDRAMHEGDDPKREMILRLEMNL
jgi:hypothetical protein